MKKIATLFFLFFCTVSVLLGQYDPMKTPDGFRKAAIFAGNRPWTRWWWFAAQTRHEDVRSDLIWLKANGFGGVEIAWVYPLNRMKKDTVNYTPRWGWLSPEWSDAVAYAKFCADSLGMGCDFTFGSLWPFGDTRVPREEATRCLNDTAWRQEITASWDYPKKGYVIDHLDRNAFEHYANRTGDALKPALKGGVSGLFCDSWEVESRYLSTKGFESLFMERYGYPLSLFTDTLYSPGEPFGGIRYDYMKLLSEKVIGEFYRPFTENAHRLGAYSRVQCSGAPCDIISAYATVDVPESEALLYEPPYSVIVASAAALAGRPVVSSETFTCLYGWPRDHQGKEQTADLKLLADALFANGVNQVIWHGKPINPAGYDTVKFYASVHVGSSGSLARGIPAFNAYMEKVSGIMKKGRTLSRLAVYLPTEDAWTAGDLPRNKQFIWAWGEYEMRYRLLPESLKQFRPLWINGEFLLKGKIINGKLAVGDQSFDALYVDAGYLDPSVLKRITELAAEGLQVCMVRRPAQPGMKKDPASYETLLKKLYAIPGVRLNWSEVKVEPVVTGADFMDYWAKLDGDRLSIFFANPRSWNLKFPLEYGQSLTDTTISRKVIIRHNGKDIPYELVFRPYQSLLLEISGDGIITPVDVTFTPEVPVFQLREKHGKEKWEVADP